MKRIALLTAGTLATLAAVLVMWQLSEIVILFIISLAVAAMMRAPAEALTRRGWRPSLAMLAVYATGIGLPLLLLAWVGWWMSGEIDSVLKEGITLYARLYSRLRSGGEMTTALSDRLRDPATLNALFGEGNDTLFVGSAVKAVSSVGTVVSQLLIAVVVSIYWTADRARFERLWLSLLSPNARALARSHWRAMESGVGAYLRSETIQSILAGVALSFAYWALGMPYPVSAAFVAALAWLIPLVGGVLGMAAIAVLGWHLGPVGVAAAVLVTMVVYLVLELYVEPRLYTRARYWRVLILLIMLAMTDAFGLLGLLVSPPLATALQIWINGLLTPQAPVQAAEAGVSLSDVHARLAEARELIEAGEAHSTPRIADLFDRLEELVAEAEEMGSRPEAV